MYLKSVQLSQCCRIHILFMNQMFSLNDALCIVYPIQKKLDIGNPIVFTRDAKKSHEFGWNS